jgi:hypothetical protein
VRVARAGVLVFGAIAYVQAIRADGVFELVENASAFGSAGRWSQSASVSSRHWWSDGGDAHPGVGVVTYLAAALRITRSHSCCPSASPS